MAVFHLAALVCNLLRNSEGGGTPLNGVKVADVTVILHQLSQTVADAVINFN